jgi:hypothetical protein
MGKVIPLNKDWIKNLSDTKFIEIEKDLLEYFNDAVHRNDGKTTIFQATAFAMRGIAEKHGLTIEQAKEFVKEMQMRKLDEELGDKE